MPSPHSASCGETFEFAVDAQCEAIPGGEADIGMAVSDSMGIKLAVGGCEMVDTVCFFRWSQIME